MSKHRSTKAIVNANGQRVTPVSKLPASRRVESPPCTACKSANTYIYATRQFLRYCKCRYCGHSFSFACSCETHVQFTPSDVAQAIDDVQMR